jgi:Flp pilus assembly protein TadG
MSRGRRDERGIVTAETAMAMPLLLLVALAMAWLVAVGLVQMQVVDASREAARALARGESAERATSLARRAAPGAEVDLGREDGVVVVRVSRRVTPPGGLLDALAGMTARASATALDEEAR